MSQHIELIEVGPRDGLQNEPQVLPLAVKRELVERLMGAGLQRIEVASFVNPKRVPQMADAEELLASLPRTPSVCFVGLVLNRKGFERALAAGCDEIGMAVVASDTFNRRNQGASTQESIAAWKDIAAAARTAGLRAQVTISAAFGCPFEGEIPAARVVDIAERLAEAQPHEICIADTIGAAVPAQVTDVLSRVRAAVPGVRLRCHFHNTRNTGLANAYAAVQAGVRALDASIGGIGGCPFAPAATGNVPTEDVLYMLERSGFTTGVSLDALIETAHWLQSQLGRSVPGMLSKAGGFPRAAATVS
jgi:hydroxymethylglutaryl-CoA lyase